MSRRRIELPPQVVERMAKQMQRDLADRLQHPDKYADDPPAERLCWLIITACAEFGTFALQTLRPAPGSNVHPMMQLEEAAKRAGCLTSSALAFNLYRWLQEPTGRPDCLQALLDQADNEKERQARRIC